MSTEGATLRAVSEPTKPAQTKARPKRPAPRKPAAEWDAAAEAALLAYARAKARMETIFSEFRGDMLDRQIVTWKRTMVRLDRTALAYRLARVEAYLERRKARPLEGNDA